MALIKKENAVYDNFTWDSFIEYYNGLIDQEILSFCKNRKYSYYGGKCTISSTVYEDEFSRSTFLIVISVLYYQENDTKKIIERIIKSKFNYREFDKDDVTLLTLRKLLKNKIEFTIESPIKGGKI